MRYIKKEITINKKIDEVFEALVAPSQIKKWWFAKSAIVLPEVGGFYSAAWGDDEDKPDYISIASISEFERPNKLTLVYEKYYSKDGQLPFEARLDAATKRLRPGMEGVAKVEVGQASIAFTVTRRLQDWLRLTLWRWMP